MILDGPHFYVNYKSINTSPRKGKAYFALEFEPGENDGGWLCVAGIAAGGRTPERVQASAYALDVVKGYFLARGRELKMGDPVKVLERMLDYINAKLHQQARSKGREFLTDLNLLACTEDRLCIAGTGGMSIFIARQGKAKKILGDESPTDLLGRGKGVRFSRLDSPVWAGDQVIMLSPALSEVFGNREISLVVQKAEDPAKAALLINALATRKQLEGDLVAIFWEVPATDNVEMAGESFGSRLVEEPLHPAPESLEHEHHPAEDIEAVPEPVVEVGTLGSEWYEDVDGGQPQGLTGIVPAEPELFVEPAAETSPPLHTIEESVAGRRSHRRQAELVEALRQEQGTGLGSQETLDLQSCRRRGDLLNRKPSGQGCLGRGASSYAGSSASRAPA